LLVNFGPGPIDNLKPFFADIERLALNSTTSTIRSQCLAFYKEAYQ